MTYSYCLIINNDVKRKHFFSYYGSNTVDIYVSRQGAKICFRLTKDYSSSFGDSYCQKLLRATIKKIFLLYSFMFKKELRCKNINLSMNGSQINIGNSLTFYSLCNSSLSFQSNAVIPSNDIITVILGQQKGHEMHIALLTSFLKSFYQKSPLEEFLLLWMSFNSFYSMLSLKSKKVLSTEKEKLDFLSQFYFHVQKQFSSNDSRVLESIKREIEKKVNQDWKQIISSFSMQNNCKINNIDSFLLCDLAYFVRCKYFHGEIPFFLIRFKGDSSFIFFKKLNDIIRDFLTTNYKDVF